MIESLIIWIGDFSLCFLRDLLLTIGMQRNDSKKYYILLDVLLCSIAEYFYELCRILASP